MNWLLNESLLAQRCTFCDEDSCGVSLAECPNGASHGTPLNKALCDDGQLQCSGYPRGKEKQSGSGPGITEESCARCQEESHYSRDRQVGARHRQALGQDAPGSSVTPSSLLRAYSQTWISQERG